MFKEDFIKRLTKLRLEKNVSARDMSLSIGQNAGYINNIECEKALPSMSAFFCICDYLNISPREFFDIETENPEKIDNILKDLKQLSNEQLDTISDLIKGLCANRNIK